MAHDADPDGIQRQPPSLATGPSLTGTVPPLLPRPQPDADVRLPGLSLLLRRLPVLAAGLALGSVFAAWVAGACGWPSWGLAERADAWLWVMGGPIVGTALGMSDATIVLGWVGLLLILAHPCRPNPATACVTLLGFCLWYFAGFIAFMLAAWGA